MTADRRTFLPEASLDRGCRHGKLENVENWVFAGASKIFIFNHLYMGGGGGKEENPDPDQ